MIECLLLSSFSISKLHTCFEIKKIQFNEVIIRLFIICVLRNYIQNLIVEMSKTQNSTL